MSHHRKAGELTTVLRATLPEDLVELMQTVEDVLIMCILCGEKWYITESDGCGCDVTRMCCRFVHSSHILQTRISPHHAVMVYKFSMHLFCISVHESSVLRMSTT
jgi:hypothetical protein